MERIGKILIIGKGGREHALGWKIKQRPARQVYFTIGNAGTKKLGQNLEIDPEDFEGLVRFVKDNHIDLTIASSDRPVANGIVDAFLEEGLTIFGPTKMAARLEWSKAWAVGFMERHNIPHPKTKICYTQEQASAYLRSRECPHDVVIKPDGLTDGKGVEISHGFDHSDAENKVRKRLEGGKYGTASIPTLIQEKIRGHEVSFFVFSDGENFVPLITACDFKQIKDFGSMTGGMGGFAPGFREESYSPHYFKSNAFLNNQFLSFDEMRENTNREIDCRIIEPIVKPTILGMREEGFPYKGVLYVGLMMAADGPKVLEYNARFGDPETQLQMRLLQSDLVRPMLACIREGLSRDQIKFRSGKTVTGVVLATEGYPENSVGGEIIKGLDIDYGPGIRIFHAGTKLEEGKVVTTGGRAVMVTSVGNDLEHARDLIGKTIGPDGVHFRGMQYRKDLVE